MANLLHQRAPVRLHSLRAIGILLPLGSEGLERIMNDTVMDALKALGFDRTASVRQELCRVVARLLTELPIIEPFQPGLLLLLLARIADEQKEVQTTALAELNAACTVLASRAASGAGADDSATPAAAAAAAAASKPLPAPFTGPVPASTASIVVAALHKLVAAALVDLTDWKATVRKSGAGQLRSIILVVREAIVEEIQAVFGGLCRGCTDEEADVRGLVNECGALIGGFVPLGVQLSVLLPQIRGEVSGLTGSEHRASSLAILSAVVSGTTVDTLTPSLEDVCAALALPSCFESDTPKLCREVLGTISSIIRVCGAGAVATDSLARNVAVVLLLLQASDKEADVIAGAAKAAQQLAAALGAPDLTAFYAANASAVLALFASTEPEWTKHSMYRMGFDAFLRVAPKVRFVALSLPCCIGHAHCRFSCVRGCAELDRQRGRAGNRVCANLESLP